LAKDISVPARRINEIVRASAQYRRHSPQALQIFRLSERFWLNLQSRYDLEVEKEKLKGRIEAEVKVFDRRPPNFHPNA